MDFSKLLEKMFDISILIYVIAWILDKIGIFPWCAKWIGSMLPREKEMTIQKGIKDVLRDGGSSSKYTYRVKLTDGTLFICNKVRFADNLAKVD